MTEEHIPIEIDAAAVYNRAKRFIERKMPDPAYRVSALKAMAEFVRYMHSKNSNCWSINFGGNGPYINIKHEIAVAPQDESNLYFHVYLDSLGDDDRKKLDIGGAKIIDDKTNKWSGIEITLPEQEHLIPYIRQAHEAFLLDKSRFDIHTLSKKPHIEKGSGMIEYMRRELGLPDLPQPGYCPPVNDNISEGGNPMNEYPSYPHINMILDSLKARGLHFTPWQVATFYTALQTKGFVILSGISGTGKTKLAQAFARLLPQPTIQKIISDDIIRITIYPYMRKYSRMIIPKSGIEAVHTT